MRRNLTRARTGPGAVLGVVVSAALALVTGCGGGGAAASACDPNPCVGLHKTSCLDLGGEARCMCDQGYVEDAAGDCVLAGSCDPNPCREEHRTRCTVVDGTAVCLCDDGYVASAIGGCVPDPCEPNPCAEPNRTVCLVEDGAAICTCDAGFSEDPNGACVPIDPCQPNPCLAEHRTRCVVDGSGVQCLCDPGYVEDGAGGCARPCDLQPCQDPPRTRCANRGENAVCLCDEGMLENEQGACVDDPCAPNPCLEPHRTACIRLDQGTSCACDPGYTWQAGTCLRAAANLCSAGGWCLENPSPAVDTLHGVWAFDAQNALAVGEAGRVLHWDGANAVALDAGTWLDVLAVDGLGVADIWAVGQDGLVLHFDGEAWSSVTPTLDPPVRTNLRAVWMADPQHIHLAGDDGVWLFLDGWTWTRIETGLTQGSIHDLWGSGPYDVWATADFGRLLHYDGAGVEAHILVDNENLYGLHAEGPEDLVISTSSGRLVRWDGEGFSQLTDPVGMAGVILTGVWGDGLGGFFASGFDILGYRGVVLRFDGSAWGEVWVERLGLAWAVSGLPGQAALAVGAGGMLVRAAPGAEAELLVTGPRTELQGLAQRPDGAVFACGGDRTLLERGPQGWRQVEGAPQNHFHDMVFDDAGVAFLAGSNGILLRWDGSAFEMLTDPTDTSTGIGTRGLLALWRLQGGEILVAGADGLAGIWDGQAWVPRNLPGTHDDLYGVWGSAADDMWVVGENLGVYHHDGNGWLPVTVPRPAALAENDDYHGIWGSGPDEVTVVGNLGTVLHLQGGAWTVEPTMTSADLFAVLGLADGTRWAAGADGAILRATAGAGWVRQESGTRAQFETLLELRDGTKVAAGAAGAIFVHAP